MQLLFWLCVVGVLYSYFLYPLMLLAVRPRRSRTLDDAAAPLSVSIVITAHNEEKRIEEKLRNTMALDYPRERLEVIVASDASSDATDDIVRRFESQGVRLVRASERKGKEYAQSLAIQAAKGDIVVFTDAGTEIPKNSVQQLVRNFADPAVGAVSSEDRFISRNGKLVGEGAYVKYEMWLRRLESRRAGLVGLSGSFFAARREVCEMWDVHAPSDFNTAISCARKGLVAVNDPEVIGYYADIKDEGKEYQRKLRTVLRGISGLSRHLEALNPVRFGWFAVQVWGHKIMRWLVPWFMLLLFGSSITLWHEHPFYGIATVVQAAGYAVVLMAALAPVIRRNVVVRIAYFFVQVNIAIAHASVLFLVGRRMAVWEPSKR